MSAMPINFREEIVGRIFKYIRSGESFFLIGAPSAGKTRLLDFVMDDDPDARRTNTKVERYRVKKNYLKAELDGVWLVRVDMNRIHQRQDGNWSFQFYELLLHSILLTSNRNNEAEHGQTITDELTALDSQVIISKDELMAHRVLEMSISRICQKYRIKLCFIFDEFDETYRDMPLEVFAQLRAIRDANKYFVSYGLFLRNLPEKLRAPSLNEAFYELISSRMIGLGLYPKRDIFPILEQWEKRHERRLSADLKEWLWEQSGGHPGVAHVLFALITESSISTAKLRDTEWFARQETIHEEFRKIFEGLTKEEQTAMRDAKGGRQNSIPDLIGKQLLAKGLVKLVNSRLIFFSPIFSVWLK